MHFEKSYKGIVAYLSQNCYCIFTKNDNSYGMLIASPFSNPELGIMPRVLPDICEKT